jgi:hypothetical protein
MRPPIAAVLALALAIAAPGRADQTPPLALHGSFDTFFAWDDVAARNGPITLATVPARNLEPAVNLVLLEGVLTLGGLHADLAFGAGTALDALHATVPGRSPGSEFWRHLVVAWAGYTIPVGRGLTLDAGLFPSYIGYETFPTRENWNWSHSFMADLSPYYQAGARLSYPFTDHLTVQVLWLNGWDVPEQQHDFRSAGAQAAYTMEKVKGALNLFVGPARPGFSTPRTFVDVWVQGTPLPVLQLAAAFDFGVDVRPAALPPRPDGHGYDWWLVACAYVRYAPIERLGFTLRAEVYDDRDAGLLTGAPELLAEATLTAALTLGPVLIKGEGRLDRAVGTPAPTTLDGHAGRELLLLSVAAGF